MALIQPVVDGKIPKDTSTTSKSDTSNDLGYAASLKTAEPATALRTGGGRSPRGFPRATRPRRQLKELRHTIGTTLAISPSPSRLSPAEEEKQQIQHLQL